MLVHRCTIAQVIIIASNKINEMTLQITCLSRYTKKNYYSPQAKQILCNICKPNTLTRLFSPPPSPCCIKIIVLESLLNAYIHCIAGKNCIKADAYGKNVGKSELLEKYSAVPVSLIFPAEK